MRTPIKALAVGITKEQRIRKALELLAPPPAEREECKHEIQLALDMLENEAALAQSVRAVGSKAKGGLKRYDAALRRLLAAFKSLDPAIKPWFSYADPNYEAVQGIEAEINKVEEFLKRPSATPSPSANWNQAAVAAAHTLLTWRKQNAAITRGGKWEKLAKILAGDQNTGLFDHLRKFRKRPARKIKKYRLKSGGVGYVGRRQPDIK
jgi:hypothetical protein